MRLISGQFLADPTPAYAFSKPLNQLEFDPTYPRNPKTLGEHIRKWRMEQGVFQRELAERLGVHEMTIVNWEIRGMVPRIKKLRDALARVIPGVFKAWREGLGLGVYEEEK